MKWDALDDVEEKYRAALSEPTSAVIFIPVVNLVKERGWQYAENNDLIVR